MRSLNVKRNVVHTSSPTLVEVLSTSLGFVETPMETPGDEIVIEAPS